MASVLFVAQDEPRALEPSHQSRRSGHVRPLMHLVGRQADGAEGDQRYRGELSASGCEGNQHRAREHWNVEHRHVAVAVDCVAAQKIVRVDMVHAEGPEESPAEQWARHAAPGIGRPMDESRHEIRAERRRHDRERRPPRGQCRCPEQPDDVAGEEQRRDGQTQDLQRAGYRTDLIVLDGSA